MMYCKMFEGKNFVLLYSTLLEFLEAILYKFFRYKKCWYHIPTTTKNIGTFTGLSFSQSCGTTACNFINKTPTKINFGTGSNFLQNMRASSPVLPAISKSISWYNASNLCAHSQQYVVLYSLLLSLKRYFLEGIKNNDIKVMSNVWSKVSILNAKTLVHSRK